MYIKIVTVKVKRKKYKYVRIVDRQYVGDVWSKKEVVIATLGSLVRVRCHVRALIRGLERIAEG